MKSLRAEQKRVVADDGTEIAYRVIGQGDPVILAGGLGAGWEAWRHQIEYLSDRFRFIAWDYRGLFASGLPLDPGTLDVPHHAADGLRVLDQENVERAALIGWSMGVHVGLEAFAQSPQRIAAMVLIGGAPPVDSLHAFGNGVLGRGLPWLARGTELAPALVESVVRAGMASPEAFTWARRLGLVGRNLGQRQFADLVAGFADTDWTTYSTVLRSLQRYDGSRVLKDIDVPTLAIVGGRDPFTPRHAVDAMVKQIRGAEFLVVPGGTHFVLVDYPEHVSLRIEKFFRERGYGAQV